MKNLYLFWAVAWVSFMATGQDLQNANWYFGNHAGITFTTSPPSALTNVTNIGFNVSEGCATVSDAAGNLLFFSDGVTVWRSYGGGFPVITSALRGDVSSTQNVIIVPRPGVANHYYIVTIDGTTSSAPPNKRGIYYSEIDISSGAGTMVSLNTPLQDHLGNLINDSYGNISEGLTSAIHSDGQQYWIVAHIKNATNSSMYSYLVTSAGINVVPVQTQAISLPVSPSGTAFTYSVKISPNVQRIGITTLSGAYLGTFNNTSGLVNLNATSLFTNNQYAYGLEFSPDSNVLYLTSTSLYKMNVNTPGTLVQVSSGPYYGLQLGIDNKIYAACTNSTTVSVINDPNNYTTPQFNSTVSLQGRMSFFGLPQLVRQQGVAACSCCPDIVYVVNTVLNSFIDPKQAAQEVEATNIIENGGTGLYHGGTCVTLKNGFAAVSGSYLHAYVEGCSGNYVGRPGAEGAAAAMEEVRDLKIAPNPSEGIFSISPGMATKGSIEIADMLGNVVYGQNFESIDPVEVNIADKVKGIYVIRVITDSGTTIRKIVKN